MSALPIHAVLPDLLAALRTGSNAVLVAPPGAGKTTAVAPALLDEFASHLDRGAARSLAISVANFVRCSVVADCSRGCTDSAVSYF